MYSTHDVARLCHVTPMTVIRWVEEGKLPAFKTAGGHRRVLREELEVFLRARGLDLREAEGLRVVIVDGDERRGDVWSAAVRNALPAAEVAVAHDAFEGGAMCAKLAPVYVVLDARTPGLDAAAVAARLRTESTVRVIVTGVPTGGDRRLREAGVVEWLPESAPPALLERKLEVMEHPPPPRIDSGEMTNGHH